MRRRSLRATVALVGALLALVVTASVAGTASATTGADLIIPIRATLTKHGTCLTGASPRIDDATTVLFLIENHSSKARGFQIGTPASERRSVLMRPGTGDRFYYVFRAPGKVPFRSAGPNAKLLTGAFK